MFRRADPPVCGQKGSVRWITCELMNMIKNEAEHEYQVVILSDSNYLSQLFLKHDHM